MYHHCHLILRQVNSVYPGSNFKDIKSGHIRRIIFISRSFQTDPMWMLQTHVSIASGNKPLLRTSLNQIYEFTSGSFVYTYFKIVCHQLVFCFRKPWIYPGGLSRDLSNRTLSFARTTYTYHGRHCFCQSTHAECKDCYVVLVWL